MKLIKVLTLGLLFGGGFVTTQVARAADPKTLGEIKVEEKGGKEAEVPSKAIPFQGTVAAVDAATRTFTLSGKTKDKERVFKVMDGTEILQGSQQSNFRAIAVGELVRGQAYKRADGWDAKKVMIGPKEEPPAKR